MLDSSVQPDTSPRWGPMFLSVVLGLLYLAILFSLPTESQTRLALRIAVAGFPLAQFLYIGPLAYYAWKSGKRKSMQGWLIGAAIAALIYSPCWGMALSI